MTDVCRTDTCSPHNPFIVGMPASTDGVHDFSTLKPDLFGMIVHDLEKKHKQELEEKNRLIEDLKSEIEKHKLLLSQRQMARASDHREVLYE